MVDIYIPGAKKFREGSGKHGSFNLKDPRKSKLWRKFETNWYSYMEYFNRIY